jgi:hypothetical protein
MDAIKRLKFWIGLGLMVVASGVVLGVWFMPAKKVSASSLSDWRSKEQKVMSYQSKTVHGMPDIGAVEDLKKDYDQQLGQARQLLAEWDKLLEDYIPDQNDVRRQLDPGTWKTAYYAQMDALEEDVQSSFPSAPANIVQRVDFGDIWPTAEEMAQEAKNYWVQYYLLHAIARVNEVSDVIPTLKSFALVDRPDRLLSADDATMFRPIAFEFQFATEFKNVPMVLHDLLQCQVPVSVTTVSMKRRAKVSLKAEQGGATTGGLLSASAVSSLVGSRGGVRPGPAVVGPVMPFGWEGPNPYDMTYHGPIDAGPTTRHEEEAPESRFVRRAPARTGARATARAGGPQTAARPRQSAEQAEAGRLLVDVVVKGYVKDFAPPKAAEQANAAGQ